MSLGGAEGVGVSANIFVGMIEAPLFIRPYLKEMTRSEIFTIMTTGMATIAGTVMVLYASILHKTIPDVMGHILTASIISVPAAVMISKIMVPETGELTSGELVSPDNATSTMDALTKGTTQGVQLLINIVAMIIVLVSLVHLVVLLAPQTFMTLLLKTVPVIVLVFYSVCDYFSDYYLYIFLYFFYFK